MQNEVPACMRSPAQVFLPRYVLILCIVLGCTACRESDILPNNVHEQIPIGDGQSVSLNIDNAEVALTNAASGDLILNGEFSSPASHGFSIVRSSESLQITVEEDRGWSIDDRPPANINIQVPRNNPLSVTGFDGKISIRDYEGVLNVHLVTGEIIADNLTGEIALVSPRGDIHVRGGSGRLRVLGEHGLLTIADVHGKVGSATIMGTIRYSGDAAAGDEIRLEADHGPIEVLLGKNTNISLLAQSNSGDVTCVIPGFTQDGRRCQGRLGNGEGTLWIRTVSGAITIRAESEVP